MGNDAVRGVLGFSAVQEEVGDNLPSLSTTAAGNGNGRAMSMEEEVVEVYLLGWQMH